MPRPNEPQQWIDPAIRRRFQEQQRQMGRDAENRRRQRQAEFAAEHGDNAQVYFWEDLAGVRHIVHRAQPIAQPNERAIWYDEAAAPDVFAFPDRDAEIPQRPAEQIQAMPAVPAMADPARWNQYIQMAPVGLGEAPGIHPGHAAVAEVPEDLVPEEDKGVKVVNEFLIGCDPEFVVIKNGAHFNVRGVMNAAGPIGWDHNGHVVEIRPRPAKSAFTLSKHLGDLIKTLKLGDKHKAGAYFKNANDGVEHTLGGHIHLDLPFELIDYSQRQRISALDEVTHRLEELDVLSKTEMPLRRTRGKAVFVGMGNGTPYGAFGDVKASNDGRRTEYRTMCSWLYSPVTTFLALTSAKLAATHPVETLTHFAFQPASKAKLRGFFELFQGKDVDAKRAVEMIFERNRNITRDPDVDVVKAWDVEWKQIAA